MPLFTIEQINYAWLNTQIQWRWRKAFSACTIKKILSNILQKFSSAETGSQLWLLKTVKDFQNSGRVWRCHHVHSNNNDVSFSETNKGLQQRGACYSRANVRWITTLFAFLRSLCGTYRVRKSTMIVWL